MAHPCQAFVPAPEQLSESSGSDERASLHQHGVAGDEGDVSLGRLARSRNLWREVSSLTLLQLVAFVEGKFAIKVRPIDFAPQNFESVSAIARFVAARRSPAR